MLQKNLNISKHGACDKMIIISDARECYKTICLISFFLQNSHFTNQVAIYTGGNQQLEWRETGQLPKPRAWLRASVVGNILYVTGGGDDNGFHTSILSWNPSMETWQQAGKLAVGRATHAAVAVPSSMLSSEC